MGAARGRRLPLASGGGGALQRPGWALGGATLLAKQAWCRGTAERQPRSGLQRAVCSYAAMLRGVLLQPNAAGHVAVRQVHASPVGLLCVPADTCALHVMPADWLEGLLTRVRSMLGLDASTHFNVVSLLSYLLMCAALERGVAAPGSSMLGLDASTHFNVVSRAGSTSQQHGWAELLPPLLSPCSRSQPKCLTTPHLLLAAHRSGPARGTAPAPCTTAPRSTWGCTRRGGSPACSTTCCLRWVGMKVLIGERDAGNSLTAALLPAGLLTWPRAYLNRN